MMRETAIDDILAAVQDSNRDLGMYDDVQKRFLICTRIRREYEREK